MSEIDDEFMGGAPSVTWGRDESKMGRWVVGTVVSEMSKTQQRVYKTNELKFWEDGRPAIQYVVTLQTTTEADPNNPSDDGTRRLFIKGDMIRAIRAAVRAVNGPTLEIGGTLAIRWASVNGENEQRIFEARYKRPVVSFDDADPFAEPEQKTVYGSGRGAMPPASVTTDLRPKPQPDFEDEPPF